MISQYFRAFWASVFVAPAIPGTPAVHDEPILIEPDIEENDVDNIMGSPNAHLASTYEFAQDKTLNGRRAEALLSDAFLNACLENIAHRYRQEMEAAVQIDDLRVAQLKVRVIKDFKTELRRHITNAKLFDVELQRRRMSEEMARF